MAARLRVLVVTGWLACSFGAPVAAQYTALPVHIAPNISPRLSTVMVAADVGALHRNTRDGRPFAARAVLNAGRVSVTAGAGMIHDSDGPNALTLGAGLGYDLYALSPRKPTFTLHGAIGHFRVSGAAGSRLTQWDVPLGVGLAWYLPALDVNLEPWLAPRAHLRVADEAVDGTTTDLGFGSSAGLNLTHALGPGLHLAMDGLRIGRPHRGGSHLEWVLSAGLHFKIALP